MLDRIEEKSQTIFTFPLHFSSMNHIGWNYVHSHMNTVISDSFIQFTWIMNIYDNLSHCVIVLILLTNDDATLFTRGFPCTQRRRYIFERTPPILTLLCYISSLKLLFWKKWLRISKFKCNVNISIEMLIFNVHRCMNYIEAVQSGWCPKNFTGTLNRPSVVHTPMDVKNKHFNTYIYITFKFGYSKLFKKK